MFRVVHGRSVKVLEELWEEICLEGLGRQREAKAGQDETETRRMIEAMKAPRNDSSLPSSEVMELRVCRQPIAPHQTMKGRKASLWVYS